MRSATFDPVCERDITGLGQHRATHAKYLCCADAFLCTQRIDQTRRQCAAIAVGEPGQQRRQGIATEAPQHRQGQGGHRCLSHRRRSGDRLGDRLGVIGTHGGDFDVDTAQAQPAAGSQSMRCSDSDAIDENTIARADVFHPQPHTLLRQASMPTRNSRIGQHQIAIGGTADQRLLAHQQVALRATAAQHVQSIGHGSLLPGSPTV